MTTQKNYYQDPYLQELEAQVIAVEPGNNLINVILDKTIFYPEGGGQPSDRGEISSSSWNTKVEYVRSDNETVTHQVQKNNSIKVGDKVKLILDWPWRYKYMRLHTGGHLLHDVIMKTNSQLKPLKASHGKKPFIEYLGEIDSNIKQALEDKANLEITKNLSVVTKETTLEEIQKECPFLPANLPADKKLRMIKIGDFPAMPDGGVHVKSTKEICKIWIANITVNQGTTNVRYGVANQ
jgi:alanyl-tRNA synthetase